MERVRSPAVAGSFYEGERAALVAGVDALLEEARRTRLPLPDALPKALIVPHAGYVYSGAVAASAYSLLLAAPETFSRVVLLGPSHRVYFRGVALPGADLFRTPAGDVPVDPELVRRVVSFPGVIESPEAHRLEHSLEVQLPFLQRALRSFSILPLVVGEADPSTILEVLEAVRGGPETLVVVSSDLSHYLSMTDARAIDSRTARTIGRLDPSLSPEAACGAFPVNGLLLAARRWHLTPVLIDLENSGETAGPSDRVVGYGAFAFFSQKDPGPGGAESEVNGPLLLSLAREAVEVALGANEELSLPVGSPWLARPGATFVTLTKNGRLRGCIGSLEARRPLLEDLRANAYAAAFHDPRFAPLEAGELPGVRFELSLLSPPEPLPVLSEEELLKTLRPGTDGVVLSLGSRRGTFLPQVWEDLPEPGDFLRHLKAKAGLSEVGWPAGIEVSRYTVKKWSEAP